jgi:hypothetical protein
MDVMATSLAAKAPITEPAARPTTIPGPVEQVVRCQGRDNGQQHSDGRDHIALSGRVRPAESLQSEDKKHGRNDVEKIDKCFGHLLLPSGEHAEHSVGDQITAHHIDGGKHNGQGTQNGSAAYRPGRSRFPAD